MLERVNTFEHLHEYISFPDYKLTELEPCNEGNCYERVQMLHDIVEYTYHNKPELLDNGYFKMLVPLYGQQFCAAVEDYSVHPEAISEPLIHFGERLSSRQYWDHAIPAGYNPLEYFHAMLPDEDDDLFYEILLETFREWEVFLCTRLTHTQFIISCDVGRYCTLSWSREYELLPEGTEAERVRNVIHHMMADGLEILL